MQKNIKRMLVLGILTGATTTLFFPVIFCGKTAYAFDTLSRYLPWSAVERSSARPRNMLITDPVNVFYPDHCYFKSWIERGHLPFWNSTIIGGRAMAPLFYPPGAALFLLFPVTVAHDLFLIIHVVMAGLFSFLYLRQNGCSRGAAIVGALSWMFNGYVMVWLEFEHVAAVAALLPALLYCFERWRRNQRLIELLYLVGAASLLVSTGSHHLVIYCALFFLCYVAWRLTGDALRTYNPSYALSRHAVALSLAGIAVTITCAYPIAASFFATENSIRTSIDPADLFETTGRLPTRYLLTILFPDFFGSPVDDVCITPRTSTQAYNNYNELCIYGGVLQCLLSACSVLLVRNVPTIVFFLLSALLTLTMAMGSILYYPLARWVPGLALSTPTRILFIFGFCLAMLPAFSLDALLKSTAAIKRGALALCVAMTASAAAIALSLQSQAAAGLLIGGALTTHLPPAACRVLQKHWSLGSPAIYSPLLLMAVSTATISMMLGVPSVSRRRLFFALAVLVTIADLTAFGVRYNTFCKRSSAYPLTEAINFLRSDTTIFRVMSVGPFLHNGLAPFGIQDIGGYASFYPRRYGEYLFVSQGGDAALVPPQLSRWVSLYQPHSALLDLLNMKYLLTPADVLMNESQWRLVFDREIKIYQNRSCIPRAFFVPQYLVVSSAKEALQILSQLSREDLLKMVVLETEPKLPSQRKGSTADSAQTTSVSITHYWPNRIEILAKVPRAGFIVLSDNFHPAWKAWVNSVPVEILQGNYIMRVVPVTAGSHQIVMRIEPQALRVSLLLSYLCWSVIAAAGVVRMFLIIRRWIRKTTWPIPHASGCEKDHPCTMVDDKG